ncbi:MAG TPA: hypothetical protein VFK13_14530 [Gemmatimonadaceae bacterium]|nr:hypothetical protein [Gemmatimonadaceae bacterium]
MSRSPIPDIPWQVTGNHWLSLPCIHPADGSIHALGMLHRGARAAVEFAGHEHFLAGQGPALLAPAITVDGDPVALAAQGLAWERALGWLPTFAATVGAESLVVRGSIFAPHGRDADSAGAVYVLAVENRGDRARRVSVALEGALGHRQLRVRTPRPFGDAHRASVSADGIVILEGSALPGLVALAVAAEDDAEVMVHDGAVPRFSLAHTVDLAPGESRSVAFYLAVGAERDAARAVAAVLRRRGWSELLSLTRESLAHLEQSVGHDGLDRLLNRNLLFAYFYGVGRALDDAHFYLVRTRTPSHALGVTVRDWEALSWTLPAVQLADVALARELLLRVCELHGYAPGSGVHYLDGNLFEPGFTLEGAAAYALAVDRYIRESGDEQVVDEQVLAETLYLAWEDLAARRDAHVPLYSSEVSLAGEPLRRPFTLHGNAVVAQALDVLRHTLDEETAREVEDPEAVRAALRRHFGVEREGRVTFAAAVDLAGNVDDEHDALASAYWLPLYEAVEHHDSAYRRTVRALATEPALLAAQCARLMGPDAGKVLQWLRRAPLDNGIAAEMVDADGRAVANGGDAAVAALLAWSIWYAVHALGVHP